MTGTITTAAAAADEEAQRATVEALLAREQRLAAQAQLAQTTARNAATAAAAEAAAVAAVAAPPSRSSSATTAAVAVLSSSSPPAQAGGPAKRCRGKQSVNRGLIRRCLLDYVPKASFDFMKSQAIHKGDYPDQRVHLLPGSQTVDERGWDLESTWAQNNLVSRKEDTQTTVRIQRERVRARERVAHLCAPCLLIDSLRCALQELRNHVLARIQETAALEPEEKDETGNVKDKRKAITVQMDTIFNTMRRCFKRMKGPENESLKHVARIRQRQLKVRARPLLQLHSLAAQPARMRSGWQACGPSVGGDGAS